MSLYCHRENPRSLAPARPGPFWFSRNRNKAGGQRSAFVSQRLRLFCSARGIKSHEGERECNSKQNDGGQQFHAYNSSSTSMSRSMRR
jgi:hypothetical protein